MPARRDRTNRDARRRSLGQNFLVGRAELSRIVDAVEIQADDLILEVGAGTGSLTVAMAGAGARVIAVEADPIWASKLHSRIEAMGLAHRVEVRCEDFESMELPEPPYRVVSNPPFRLTTALMSKLLDHPERGPHRADLLLQLEVARKRAMTPPRSLRSAAWAPWWTFELGPVISRSAFRPVPRVDAALLTIHRRRSDVLPLWLAPRMRDLLRPGWSQTS